MIDLVNNLNKFIYIVNRNIIRKIKIKKIDNIFNI